MTPIEWHSSEHRWALVRHSRSSRGILVVSQHTNPRAAAVHFLMWKKGEPFLARDHTGAPEYEYTVTARDRAAERDLAAARQRIASENTAARRIMLYLPFQETELQRAIRRLQLAGPLTNEECRWEHPPCRRPIRWSPPDRDQCLQSRFEQWTWQFAWDPEDPTRWRLVPELCYRGLLNAEPPGKNNEDIDLGENYEVSDVVTVMIEDPPEPDETDPDPLEYLRKIEY